MTRRETLDAALRGLGPNGWTFTLGPDGVIRQNDTPVGRLLVGVREVPTGAKAYAELVLFDRPRNLGTDGSVRYLPEPEQ